MTTLKKKKQEFITIPKEKVVTQEKKERKNKTWNEEREEEKDRDKTEVETQSKRGRGSTKAKPASLDAPGGHWGTNSLF